jgi:peptidoglycan/LPS O-acetylase OafA/YrhL
MKKFIQNACRHFRLTPAVIAILVLRIIFIPKLGSGPFWNKDNVESCRANWWYFLFYVQNFSGPRMEVCFFFY